MPQFKDIPYFGYSQTISDVELLNVHNAEHYKKHVKRKMAIQLAEHLLDNEPSVFEEHKNPMLEGITLTAKVYMFSEGQFHQILLSSHEEGVKDGERNFNKAMGGIFKC